MASKNNFGYYDENGKDPNAYESWNAWLDPTTGKNRIPGAHYVKFKSEEEKKEFIASKKTVKKTSAKSVRNGGIASDVFDKENTMIKNGEWEKYLFENITCENLVGYDALCVSDASYDKEDGVGSFGVIVIPLKDGEMDGDIIVESVCLKDIDNVSFERVRYDMNGLQEKDTIHLDKDVYEKLKEGEKYVKSGEADRAESESATRVIEICEDNNWNKIVYISDCQPLLQAIKKGESKAPGNIRVINKKKEWGGAMELRKVGSHKNAIIGEMNEVGPNGDNINPWEFDRDKSRLYALLNDLVDLMAKAEVEAKGGSAQELNKPSVHLIPDEDGAYLVSGAASDMNKIYAADISEDDRRAITREMVERVVPLIKRALSNGIVSKGRGQGDIEDIEQI